LRYGTPRIPAHKRLRLTHSAWRYCLRLANALVFAGIALFVSGCGTGSGGGSIGGSGSGSSPTPSPAPTLQHVVIIVQENRTPDNLFQGVPGADIATSGLNSSGQTVPLEPIPLAIAYDIDHSHPGFLQMYDNGKMDGANNLAATGVCAPTSATPCPYANPQYGYVPASENAPYVQMATQYTFADRMFETNQGPSFPAHQFLLSGTSEPSVGSDLLVSEETGNPGCGPEAGSLVTTIDPSGSEAKQVPSCFEHPTLPDLLDAKGVSWRYYASSTDVFEGPAVWIAPNSISHLRLGPDWAKVVTPETTVLDDIRNRTLRQVSWVTPSPKESDHAGASDGTGPAWVASIVNAIGQSPYWNNTTIFIVWDDWGGWYDHVKPPIYNSYELGFRVPLIVVSPYAKQGYVSHVQHEFGSILKFVEEQYDLGGLGYTDSRSDDLSDCFSFAQTPVPFRTIQARYSAKYFLMRPPDKGNPDTDF
jgi:phospholipase C